MTVPDSTADEITAYRDLLAQFERDILELDRSKTSRTEGVGEHLDELRESIASVTSELAARFKQEQGFVEVSRKIANGVYLEEALDNLYELFRPLIPYDRIGCALLERRGNVARARWARTDYENPKLKVGFWAKLDDSSLQTIVETGKPRVINNLVEYLEQHPNSMSTRLLVDEGVRSSLTCPLTAEGRTVGFLFFSSTKVGCYAGERPTAFMRLADLVSIAVQKSQVLEEMTRLNTELLQARILLKYQDSHDALTGLMNRSAIVDELTNRTDRESDWLYTEARSLAVLAVDIDGFRAVNDTFGPEAADQALRSVSASLVSELRSSDSLGRRPWGGQFIVLAEVSDRHEPQILAERLRSSIERRTIVTDAGPIPITVNVGVAALNPGVREGSDSLIRRAEHALYEAKAAGTNRVVVAPFAPTQ